MLLPTKKQYGYLLFVLVLSLTGCTGRQAANQAVTKALEQELISNQQQFLNKPAADILVAFQRRPSHISTPDEKHNVVWLYQIYDILLDPDTGQPISRPDTFTFLTSKIRWQEYYYVNQDGMVYDIKVDYSPF